ncbi:glycine cleavage system protein H [Enterococcus diestrammenae]|uniref:Glycine cleavage system H protein n=1 Tax=Enterococcus diestrammenae TaxID=1155073 RepID=A0ABV0F6V8_9ENTE|nr:glycine cleavage system protein H [Enterococcus diestrammenae]KAF1296703.1 glycine cleavage system protein H [Enterococcus diestrammenae]
MEKKCLKTTDNLWVLFNGSEYVVGLTNQAQEELGKVTFANLPKAGTEVKQGQPMVEVEAEKAVQEFVAPLSGVISSVNDKIAENIDVLNDEDEMNAWLLSLKGVDTAEFDNL